MVMLYYRGVDPAGNGRSGWLEVSSPWAFVHAAFDMGWRELVVYVKGRPDPAGRIEVDEEGRRTWWGEP